MKSNLYKKLRTLIFTGGLVCVSMYAMTNAGGPPAENTNAPGDNNCGQSGCHNFNPITTGANWSNIALTSNIPSTGYVPGNTYNLTLSHAQAGHSVFGFQATVQDANNVNAGSFTSGSGSAVQTSNGKSYINHTSGGTSGLGGRSWSFSWTAPSSGTLGALTMYIAVNAANGDAATTGDTIFTKAFIFYQTGTAPPTVTFVSDKSTVCQGDTVQFTSTVDNGGPNPGYTWNIPGSAFIAPSTANSPNPKVVFNGSFAGSSINRSIFLSVNNANGSANFTSNVLVNALPAATTTPSAAFSICGNDSVALTAATGNNYTYLWTPGNATTQTIYAKANGNYSVKVMNSVTGCVKTSSPITGTLRTLPTVVLSTSTDSICAGDSVTFTATAGFNNYDFYSDTTRVQTGTKATFKGAPSSSSQQYTVRATDANGCRSNASNAKSLNVQTPLSSPNVTCDLVTVSSIRFAWVAVSGADGYEVSLDSGKNWVVPTSGATGLTHTVSGLGGATRQSIYVRATQASGKCAKGSIGTGVCQTTGCTAVSFKLNYDSAFCNPIASDSVPVTIVNSSTTNYSVKVDQVSSTGAFISNVYPYGRSANYKLKLNGTNRVYYMFTMLDSVQLNCAPGVVYGSVIGVVSPASDPTLTFGKTTNVLCDREQASFTFSKPAGTNKYDFRKNNVSLATTTQTSLAFPSSTFANNDVLTVVAMDTTKGCGRSSTPFTIARKSTPRAGFTFAKDSTTRKVTFSDTTTGSISWAWVFGDNGTASTKNTTHTYALNGTYTTSLSIVTSDLCASDTASAAIRINTGLVTIDGLGMVKIYPNPVKTMIQIDMSKVNTDQDINIELTDMQGKLIRTNADVMKNNQMYQLDLSNLSKAMYMLNIRSGNIARSFPIIKE